MELKLAVEGSLVKFYQRELKTAEGAVTTAIRRATNGTKAEMRRRVKRAGLSQLSTPGRDPAKTWRSKLKPDRGISLEAEGFVFNRWKPMLSFIYGAAIRARNGTWLAIPTDLVGRRGNKRLKPRDFNFLHFVPTRNPNVARLMGKSHSGKDGVYFWLVRQTRIEKRFSFDDVAMKWGSKLPHYVITEWNRRAQRAGAEKL